MAILTGDKASVKGGNGRVLESTKDDQVFVNFVDHGGVGIIAFPNDLLHADDLIKTLTTMSTKNMFSQLVFYLEACESGSMFASLPSNIKIYATTAANADESSWGTYCPPQDSVNGKELNTCLGDLYSVNWMENTDAQKAMSESLENQFEVVKNETTQSHVCEFGDQSFVADPIGDFLGDKSSAFSSVISMMRSSVPDAVKPTSHVDSRDAKLHSLYYQYVRAKESTEKQAKWALFSEEVQHRDYVDSFFKNLCYSVDPDDGNNLFEKTTVPTQWQCIKALNAALAKCGVWSDYGHKYHRVTVNLCEEYGLDTMLNILNDGLCMQKK
jgi:legumain